MAATSNEVQRARELRVDEGWTHEAIGRELGKSTKTIQRWQRAGWTTNRVYSGQDIRRNAIPEDWPEERLWPNWTPEELSQLVGWPMELAQSNIRVVKGMEKAKNFYVPWFFRRMVEVGHKHGTTYEGKGSHEPWLFPMAGFPVLAEWLDSTECDDLTALIDEHQPWRGGGLLGNTGRRKYARTAKPLGDKISLQLWEIGAAINMQILGKSGAGATIKDLPALPLYIEALTERMPMFDRVPRLSLNRSVSTGDLLLKIFCFPKKGGQK